MDIRPNSVVSEKSYSSYHSLYESDDDLPFVAVGDLYERPKVALRKKLSLIHPLVHILPLAATGFAVSLSFGGVYWEDDGPYDTTWQYILQFPAKLHEILVVGSLSAIVLHIFRRMMVGRHGLPLGLVVGAYQMGSAEYLTSKSFVKPLRHSIEHRYYKMFFVSLALGLAILYSFLVGPASAGALLPFLDWWDFIPFNESPLASYINLTSAEIYPMSLQVHNVHPQCLENSEWQGCPQEGFNELRHWASDWSSVDRRYDIKEGQRYDPTMLSSFGRARREIVSAFAHPKESIEAAATAATVHASVLALTDLFWHYADSFNAGEINKVKRPKLDISPNTPVRAPMVQTQCRSFDYGKVRSWQEDTNMVFGTNLLNDFTGLESDRYLNSEWVVPKETWNVSFPLQESHVTWVDTSMVETVLGERLQSSLAAIVRLPRQYTATLPDGTWSSAQASSVTACMIDARWADTNLAYDAKFDDVVRHSLVDWLRVTDLSANETHTGDGRSRWGLSEAISISPEWAAAVDNKQATSSNGTRSLGNPTVRQLLDSFVSLREGSNGFNIRHFQPSNEVWNANLTFSDLSNTVAAVLSVVVTDWLSRSTLRGTNFTAIISPEENGNMSTINLLGQKDLDKWSTTGHPVSEFERQTRVEFTVQRYGWGYGLRNSNIWFSIIILLIHAVLVLVYFGYSFAFWLKDEGWASGAWGSVGELVSLAILSRPAKELKATGAGIDRSKTWMTRLRIRERDSDQLELVVGTRGGTVIPDENLLKIGKEYV